MVHHTASVTPHNICQPQPAVVWWASANSEMFTPVSGYTRAFRHLRCLVFLFALFFLSIHFFVCPPICSFLFSVWLCPLTFSVMVCVLTSICPWGPILLLLLPSLNLSWCYFYIASFLLLSLVWLLIHRCPHWLSPLFLYRCFFFCSLQAALQVSFVTPLSLLSRSSRGDR